MKATPPTATPPRRRTVPTSVRQIFPTLLQVSGVLSLALTGCLDQSAKGPSTGALLQVDYAGHSDVVGFHLEVTRVACSAADSFRPFQREENVHLTDRVRMGGVEVRGNHFDADTRHTQADLFLSLQPGCYDVLAVPAADLSATDFQPSAECASARSQGLRVADGQTTETQLISQCIGDEGGALDTLVTLNHPPDVVLSYPTTDRNGDGIVNLPEGGRGEECAPVEVCAVITDTDDDPIEVTWARSAGAPEHALVRGPLRAVGFSEGRRVWEQCATITPKSQGRTDLQVTAWDLGSRGGAVVRMESLLAEQGSEVTRSRDEEIVSIETVYADDPLCFTEAGGLVTRAGSRSRRAPGCSYTPAASYYCSGAWPTDPVLEDQLCEGTSLKTHSLYPECEADPNPPIVEPLTGKTPAQPDLSGIVIDQTAAKVLGKALFWDLQVGSDGVACASCHYSAGGDIRIRNSVNPGPDNRFGGTPAGHPVSAADQILELADFPFHQLRDPDDRESEVLKTADDRTSSQGAFGGAFVEVGEFEDVCTPRTSGLFSASGKALRQVEPRNTPTTINAAFNFRNFWDGRANNRFNGTDPFGRRSNARNPQAGVLVADDRIYSGGTWTWRIDKEQLDLPHSSLASQAVGPPLSDFEMSCAGRTWGDIARRLYSLQPLGQQEVASDDSLFSTIPGLIDASGMGLVDSYPELIQAAFDARYWQGEGTWTVRADGRVVADAAGHTQMELNLPLFFGIAVQLYEATLISDQTAFDRSRLSAAEARGLAVFVGQGKCVNCHNGALFSSAAFTPDRVGSAGFKQLERMIMGNDRPAVYDNGFYNIGVRPTAEDIGVGGTDPFGYPLSFSRQFVDMLARGTDPIDPGVRETDACEFESPFTTTGDCRPRTGTFDQRVAVDGAFKTPILRNVGLNPPYMHNGGQASLLQVVEFYDRGGDRRGNAISGDTTGFGGERSNLDPDITRLGLSDSQKADLVSFLLALTDPRVSCHQAPFDHPELPLTDGHLSTDSSPADGQRDDRIRILPAVGAGGLAAVGRPCQANTGDLFGTSQDVFATITR